MDWFKLKETIYHFEGSMLDLYILNTTRSDWQKWIDYVNEKYSISFVVGEEKIIKDRIEYNSVLKYWDGNTNFLRGVTLVVKGIDINCHFFTDLEIENHLDPRKIKQVEDHFALIAYMLEVSTLLSKPMIMTPENVPSIELIRCFQGKFMTDESHWS